MCKIIVKNVGESTSPCLSPLTVDHKVFIVNSSEFPLEERQSNKMTS